ncbi:MAG: hypothetical protein JST30_12575 [Armatimonadetes bacterium]|nr:hypothetical protein [Armatimonadota bacterium]
MADYPRTEEGLQAALGARERAREAGDAAAEGDALLALSFLVKWVRSDTCTAPFERSLELALEAIDVFRRIGDQKGEVRALIRAVSPMDPLLTQERLAKAREIAEGLGDMKLIADVTAALARSSGLTDKAMSQRLSREALSLYEGLGDFRGQAGCHFSLSIAPGESRDKMLHAVQAFELYRRSGDAEEAGRALMPAMMNAETDADKAALEPHCLLALEDARASGEASRIKPLLRQLAAIALAQDDLKTARARLQEERSLLDPEEPSPIEQWETNVYFTKMMLSVAQKGGSKEDVGELRRSLGDLMRNRPRA